MYRLSADQMGGTTTTSPGRRYNVTVIPQYIVLAPTSMCNMYWSIFTNIASMHLYKMARILAGRTGGSGILAFILVLHLQGHPEYLLITLYKLKGNYQ